MYVKILKLSPISNMPNAPVIAIAIISLCHVVRNSGYVPERPGVNNAASVVLFHIAESSIKFMKIDHKNKA